MSLDNELNVTILICVPKTTIRQTKNWECQQDILHYKLCKSAT